MGSLSLIDTTSNYTYTDQYFEHLSPDNTQHGKSWHLVAKTSCATRLHPTALGHYAYKSQSYKEITGNTSGK